MNHDSILNSFDSIRADLQCSTDLRTSTKFDAETFELVSVSLLSVSTEVMSSSRKTERRAQPENDENFVQVPGHHRLRAGKIELSLLNWSALKLGGESMSLPVRKFRRPRGNFYHGPKVEHELTEIHSA